MPPREALTGKDRFIAKLVSFLNRAIYRDVQVHRAEAPPADAPTLTVANHFGGLADALVLLYALPRRPGIIARDVIWKVPLVGALMNWIGAIPVHKPEDGADESANDQMFGSCYGALREGGQLLIFPEGVTRNEPSIARVKTGAARIALGARASGAEGIVIAPVGIHYEDKAVLRSRVVVNIGRPLDLDELAADLPGDVTRGADDHDAVEALTATIDRRLRRVAPDYTDWQEANTLTAAAEVTLRPLLDDPGGAVPIGLRDRLANVLADRSAPARHAIGTAMAAYQDELDAVGLVDRDVEERISTGTMARTLIGQAVTAVLLAPFALVGALINAIPLLIVRAVGRLRLAPSMLSTIKPIVAVLSFGLAWGLVLWWATGVAGVTGAAATFVLMPVYLGILLTLADRLVHIGRVLRRWWAGRRRGGPDASLAEDRAAVVDAVLAA